MENKKEEILQEDVKKIALKVIDNFDGLSFSDIQWILKEVRQIVEDEAIIKL